MLMYVYTTFCLSIHLPMGIWVFSTFWLFVNNVAMNISVQISSSLSILLGLDQEVEFLDYMCVRKKNNHSSCVSPLFSHHYHTHNTSGH